MREYARVSPQFWLGTTGRRLRGNPTAQLVALYLMTSPHANGIGVFHCPALYIAHETGCPMQGVSKALRSLSEAGFLTWDEASETVWVHEMARFQVGESLKPGDKRVTWLRGEFDRLPRGLIRQGFLARYAADFHLTPDPEKDSPIEGPSEPHRSQEQEQEHEQEQEQDSDTTAAFAANFDRLRSIYPKRAGAQSWPRAEKAIRARIAEGYTWVEILEGAERYAAFVRATGKERTEYVQQAATFCGPGVYFRQDWTPPATRADVRLTANLSAAQEFLRRTGGDAIQ